MESDLVAEVPLQRGRLHSFGRHLNRIEHIDAQGDQVGNQRANGPATVRHELHPRGVATSISRFK